MIQEIDLAQVAEDMFGAIELEVATIRKELGGLGKYQSVKVENGELLVPDPGAYLYRFQCRLEERIPTDPQIQLVTPGESVSGEVFEHDPDLERIDLTLRNRLGDASAEGDLQFDTSHLLTALAQRLRTIVDNPAGFFPFRGLDLLTGRGGPVAAPPIRRDGLAPSQQSAIGFAVANDVAYIWGPPGTGKTRTVAHLIHEFIERGERVLVTAHTNVATDTALLQALKLQPLPDNRVVRVGFHAEALRDYEVGLDAVVGRVLRAHHPDVLAEIDRICAQAAVALSDRYGRRGSPRGQPSRRLRIALDALRRSNAPDLAALVEQATSLEQFLRDLERKAIASAALVATTLTRLYVSPLLKDFRTDNLVIDEASVASLPQSFVAASLASKRAIAVGDFMQLPTIVKTDHPQAKHWLGRHVFASAGANRADREHVLRAMLVEQYRMHPQISELVSCSFYAGRLRDSAAVVKRSDPGPAILLVDSIATECRSETTPTGSKRNPEHCRIVADLVEAAATKDIAVIAPYRAQIRLIRDELRRRTPELLNSGDLEVFTVHRFQGRDKELVIFDTVEAPGTRCFFLNELKNPDAPNLINVALSRAIQRLVIIANISHLKSALGQDSLLSRIFKQIRLRGGVEAAWDFEDDRNLARDFLGRMSRR